MIKYALALQLKTFFSLQDVLDALILDKKSFNRIPRFVIIDKIGSALDFENDYCTQVEETLVKKALQWMFDEMYEN